MKTDEGYMLRLLVGQALVVDSLELRFGEVWWALRWDWTKSYSKWDDEMFVKDGRNYL